MNDTGHDISTREGLAAYRADLAANHAAPKPRVLASLTVRDLRLSLAVTRRVSPAL